MPRRFETAKEELATAVGRAPASRAADAVSPSPQGLNAAAVWSLQRSAGNHAVAEVLAGTAAGRSALARRRVPNGDAHLQRDDTSRTSISETTDTGNKYTQDLILNKTTNRITISLGVSWAKKGTWATDAAYAGFLRRVKTAAYGYLDNKFKVVCTPAAPGAGAGVIELPIDFLIYDSDSGYAIEAVGGTPGGDSAMAQAGGKVFEIQTNGAAEEDITYAHEFGHAILGASDEYANPAVPGRVLTNDHSIMANYYAQGKSAAEFKARHFQHIVTEVAKAFAGYTCGLRKM